MIVLVDYIEDSKAKEIDLFLGSRQLGEKIKKSLKSIVVHNEKYIPKPFKLNVGALVPNPVRAVASLLRYYIKRHRLFLRNIKKNTLGINNNIGVLSYFPNFDVQAAETGQFKSNYWAGFSRVIPKKSVDWVFMFNPSKQCRNVSEMIAYLDLFNAHSDNNNFHAIEEYSSIFSIFPIFFDYLRLSFKSFLLYTRICGVMHNAKYDFREFHKHDINKSLFGSVAVQAAMYAQFFKNVLKNVCDVKAFLYLMENHAWERCFLGAIGVIDCNMSALGYVHSTIRPCDFRYFNSKEYYLKDERFIPEPTAVMVNGKGARRTLVATGMKEDSLINVEALRYLYLSEIDKLVSPAGEKKKVVLVFFDILSTVTNEMIDFLSRLKQEQYCNIKFVLKFHPFYPQEKLAQDKLSFLNIEITYKHPLVLLPEADWVFCSSATSCVAEAAYLGKKIIVWLPADGINICLFSQEDGVEFISGESNFDAILAKAEPMKLEDNYFYLDNNLPKWNALVSECIA